MISQIKLSSVSGRIILLLALFNIAVISAAILVHVRWYWLLLLTLPLLLLAVKDVLQTGHAIIRNYPLLGRLRYLFESIRPEIRQYFFESDLDGKPFNRRQRSIVYQRAKNERQTVAFGMQANPMMPGYEWVQF